MHVVRILLALILGGLASITLAHPLAEAYRPIHGAVAGLRAAVEAPFMVAIAAFVVVLLTYPFRR